MNKIESRLEEFDKEIDVSMSTAIETTNDETARLINKEIGYLEERKEGFQEGVNVTIEEELNWLSNLEISIKSEVAIARNYDSQIAKQSELIYNVILTQIRNRVKELKQKIEELKGK